MSSGSKRWPPIRYNESRKNFVVDVGTKLSKPDPETGKKRRVREYFKNKAEAKTFAEQCRIKLKNQGVAGFKLSNQELVDAEQALKILNGKTTLSLACEHYIKFHSLPEKAISTAEMISEFLKYKTTTGAIVDKAPSERTINDYKHRLGLVQKSFGQVAINQFSENHFLEWLSVRGDARGLIRTTKALFSHAVQKNYLSENPIRTKIPKLKMDKPSILENKQWETLIIKALETQSHRISDRGEPINLLAFVTLGLWCGLRPESELNRLDWSDVNIEDGFVNIHDDWKVAIGRHVTIPECAKNLLRQCITQKGKIVSQKNFRRRWEWLRKEAGVFESWDSDIMRHTFASNHYGYFRDKQKIINELGHCNSSMLRHYVNHGAKIRKTAEKFFKFKISKKS